MKLSQKNGKHIAIKFILALPTLVLAFSIFHFSFVLLKINRNIPSIVNEVTLINKNIDTITTKSIPDILKVIPDIIAQVDSVQSKIPLVIKETQAIRSTTIPNIISRIESMQQQIPSILKRIDTVNAKTPAITASISEVASMANQAMLRVDSINKQIPEILATIKITNDSISSYIREAKVLVAQADDIANTAGRDATKGLLTGIISTPFDITRGIGGFIFGKRDDIKEEEIKELLSQTLLFLNKNNNDTETAWISSKINASGKIKVLKTYTKKGRLVKKLLITFKKEGDGVEKNAKGHFFKQKDGQWNFWK